MSAIKEIVVSSLRELSYDLEQVEASVVRDALDHIDFDNVSTEVLNVLHFRLSAELFNRVEQETE